MTRRTVYKGARRCVLVAVVGRTPAIITETLWVLEQLQKVHVDEIRVITTSEGQRAITDELLGDDGQFQCYCREYAVPSGRLAFSTKSIHLLLDARCRPLDDIRSSEDNNAAADQIYSLIKQWTQRPEEILLCSAAGGRKTLGIYLSMALMLCGRADDRLMHILVAPEFETGVRGFYYPPAKERSFRCFTGVDESGRPLYRNVSSADAALELADIPYPKLREIIGGELPLELGLTAAIAHSQRILGYLQAPPKLLMQLDRGVVQVGVFQFSLSRQLMAVYAFMLLQVSGVGRSKNIDELFAARLALARLERTMDCLRQGEQESYAWERMKDVDDFRARIGPCISKLNRAITQALGNNRLAELYRISTGRAYGIQTADFQIDESKDRPWLHEWQ